MEMSVNDQDKENGPPLSNIPSTEQTDADLPLHFTSPTTSSPNISNMDIICEDGVIIPVLPSTSTVSNTFVSSVSATIILRLPKMSEKPNRSRNRSQKSKIHSDTPFKIELEEVQKSKETKQKKIENFKKKLDRSKM